MIRALIYFIVGTVSLMASLALAGPDPSGIGPNNEILTTDRNDVVSTTDIDGNPIKQWVDQLINGAPWSDKQLIGNLIREGEDINTFEKSIGKALDLVKTIINYALWLAALIALIILIFYWIQILVHQWEEAGKKAGEAIKKVWLALAGLAFSWIIVSFIFFLIDVFTKQ